jgi:endonuclease YncB( thermonuclease family)
MLSKQSFSIVIALLIVLCLKNLERNHAFQFDNYQYTSSRLIYDKGVQYTNYNHENPFRCKTSHRLSFDLKLSDRYDSDCDVHLSEKLKASSHPQYFDVFRSTNRLVMVAAICFVFICSTAATTNALVSISESRQLSPSINTILTTTTSTSSITTNNFNYNLMDLDNTGKRYSSTTATIILQILLPNPFFQQFETVGMIPKSYFDNHNTIYGYVERIIDGDTIRVRHVPPCSTILPMDDNKPKKTNGRRNGISDTTLLIRLYGVDCPEIAKNKNQVTQPYGNEAKQYMTERIYHQNIKLTLLRKDQYGRAIAMVETIPSLFTAPNDLSIELARQGLAELYTGGGAEYYVRFLHDVSIYIHDK